MGANCCAVEYTFPNGDRATCSTIRKEVAKAIDEAHETQKHPDPSIGCDSIDGFIEVSIKDAECCLLTCPPPEKAVKWLYQSELFHVKFKRMDNKNDLELAIVTAERAFDELLPDADDNLQRMIPSHLAGLLHLRYGRTKSTEDLRDSCFYGELAYEATPSDSEHRVVVTDRLALFLHSLYLATGEADLLERSLTLNKECISICPKGSSTWCISANLLSLRLKDQYNHTSAERYLDESTRLATEVLAHTASDDPELYVRLSNLAGNYSAHHIRGRNPGDLDLAIKTSEAAMKACKSQEEANFVQYNYAVLLHRKFVESKDLLALDLAIELAQRCITRLPDQDSKRGERLFGLANMYFDKYEAENPPERTRIPVEITQNPEAVVEFLNSRPNWFQEINLHSMDKAIETYRRALEALPDAHLMTAKIALAAGRCSENRLCRTMSPDDAEKATFLFEKAWRAEGSPLIDRIQGARNAAKLYAYVGDLDLAKANQLLSDAVEMLPMLSPRSIDDGDRQHTLRNFAGLASSAVEVALETGCKPSHALRLLEIGRGVMASLTMQLRTDTSDLRKQCPQLVDEFERLRRALDEPSAADSALEQGKERRDVERRFQDLLRRIRKEEGFGDFLQPPPVHELQKAVGNGFLVLINVSSDRSDAFIIDSGGLRVLRLPRLDYWEAFDRTNYLLKRPGWCSMELLEWLWDSAAGPILDDLGLTSVPADETWPRIHWVLTGPLVHLPIHAAGYHNSKNTVLDRAMSSYCTSATSFAYGRRQKPAAPGGAAKIEDRSASTLRGMYMPTAKPFPYEPNTPVFASSHTLRTIQDRSGASGVSNKALIVAMEKTRGMKDLEFATGEVEKVGEICRSMGLDVLSPESPSQSDLLDYLKSCSIFHFAGHGKTNSKDPSKSSLHLQDTTLTVADLRSSNLPQQSLFLAYLSACSTGANRNEELLDEGIHLISGFQLAGFRHVIGTLWQVSDEHCVPVAAGIYEMLLNQRMDDETVCKSLHLSIRALRATLLGRDRIKSKSGHATSSMDRYAELVDDDPLEREMAGGDRSLFHWVPYVHFGP